MTEDEEVELHIGCPSWPNCDEAPLGCIHEVGLDEVEWYGHKDRCEEKLINLYDYKFDTSKYTIIRGCVRRDYRTGRLISAS